MRKDNAEITISFLLDNFGYAFFQYHRIRDVVLVGIRHFQKIEDRGIARDQNIGTSFSGCGAT